MKWINHIAIAGAATAIWRPELVPIAVLGSTAPDWLEWVLKAVGRRARHRTVTHYVAAWLFGLFFGLWLWDYHHVVTAFTAGGLSHVIADALTVQGVPLGWWSDRRFHLFGGRLRTGQMGEYWLAGVFVLACIGISAATRHYGATEYSPFFWDFADYYHQGLIDGHEWREHRFRWL
jgi:inner membrane protein